MSPASPPRRFPPPDPARAQSPRAHPAAHASAVDAIVAGQQRRRDHNESRLDPDTRRLVRDLRDLPGRIRKAVEDLDDRAAAIRDTRTELAERLRLAAEALEGPSDR